MFADHWEWNGASWNLVLDGEGGPGLLSGLALAYDASRERVVLFGGSNNGTTLLDTTYEY
jgi:hypothetical protein